MSQSQPSCLVILAGGQSRRMGQEKATLELGGQRLVDRLVERFSKTANPVLLSASRDFETGLVAIADDSGMPGGPVGAIFSIATQLPKLHPGTTGFTTIPVDTPFAPKDLIERLSGSGSCAVAKGPKRLHPAFAHWDCDAVNNIRRTRGAETDAPSLHWLTRQCGAKTVGWPDEQAFININTPDDLAAAEAQIKGTDAWE